MPLAGIKWHRMSGLQGCKETLGKAFLIFYVAINCDLKNHNSRTQRWSGILRGGVLGGFLGFGGGFFSKEKGLVERKESI